MPKTTWSLKNWLWSPALGLKGFFGMSFFKHVVVLHGNALGGGSVTYANTLLIPPDHIWDQGSWAKLHDWKMIMPKYYAIAQQMLGVTTNKILGPADNRLKEMARHMGVEESFYQTDVGVFFGDGTPGVKHPDPYFNGQGPERTSCIGCGGCMVGCQHGAKNSLDMNYLYLAEKNGAKIFTETKVIDVTPVNSKPDGSDGYEITMSSHSKKFKLKSKGVIFSGSSLGTQELLFHLKETKSLPHLSDAIGSLVRTNAESLIGVRYPASKVDLSAGLAIGSGIYIDQNTHIEATRYPKGSDTMGLLVTVMTKGRPDITRIFTWFMTLCQLLLTKPFLTLKTLNPIGFAKECMIFLCMQSLDGHITMKYKRRWFWPFKKTLTTEGPKIPTFIPAANDFAIKAAKATGGFPLTSITEIFFNVPMTAHCIGGAVMSDSPQTGVCDSYNRVFNYSNLYICDGSMLAANLGVNPSLTITALSEFAMSHIPKKEVC
jgi:cholesterol oxidase